MKSFLLILVLGLFSLVNGNCWWTGCQQNSWAVKGCAQYNRQSMGTQSCPGGQKYNCCPSKSNPAPSPGSSGVQISYEEFGSAVTNNGYRKPTISQYNSFMSQMKNGRISTKQEAAMALAQFIHESGGLLHKKEIACAQTGCPGSYENPCDVPGKDYYGRGYIQLTWCYNYGPASQDLYGNRRLLDNPDIVADNEDVAWATAFWFWSKFVHDHGGSSGRFGATTNKINGDKECKGGPNHIANKRLEIYGKVRSAFGLPGAGDPSGCHR